MYKPALTSAAIFAALAVVLGAFGAHALKQVLTSELLQTFETGVKYQFYHSFALLATGIAFKSYPVKQLKLASTFFIIGIVLFSGSLYALTMLKNPTNSPTIASRKVAIICTDGVSQACVMNMKSALQAQDAKGFIVAPHLGSIATDADGAIAVDFSFLTASSVLFDAVYVPDGLALNELAGDSDVNEFLNDAYKHCKVIGADGQATEVLSAAPFAGQLSNADDGLILTSDVASESFADDFIAAMSQHRFW
ncbi:MAG: DUF423 domain-containing protein, partial [Sphingobacteriales bacterium]